MPDNTQAVLGTVGKNKYSDCENHCIAIDGCTAFSYEYTGYELLDMNSCDECTNNCRIYTGGPYTKGDGRTNTKCYIRPGDFSSFFKICNSIELRN